MGRSPAPHCAPQLGTAPGAGSTGEELRMLAAEIKLMHSHLLITNYSIDPSTRITYNDDCGLLEGRVVALFMWGQS